MPHLCHTKLSDIPELGKAFVDPTEQLKIPELVKRLLTYSSVATRLKDLENTELPSIEIPDRFRDISRSDNRWTGWFQGDGDRIGNYLKNLASTQIEADTLNQFSLAMMDWGTDLKHHVRNSRIIYASDDDFLGVLYRTPPEPELTALEGLDWFYQVPQVWNQHKQQITVSVGFVWAAPGVPQRDVLQKVSSPKKPG